MCCLRCRTEIGTRSVPIPANLRAATRGRDTWHPWEPCACDAQRERRRVALEAEAAQRESEQRRRELAALLEGIGLDQVADMTLARFDPRRLRDTDVPHPYPIAAEWLAEVMDRPRADYHDRSSPRAGLFFYSPADEPGRGKTHLAAALGHEIARQHALVAFLHEHAFTGRAWALSFEAKETAFAVPGDRAWLTIVDDMGRRPPGDGVRSVYDDLINRRWLARRWLIVTSNYLPDELRDRGTLTAAAHSRLMQMTRGEVVFFDGDDQRLTS